MKYILFDFDGTLIDSMPFLEKNAVTLLMKYFSYTEQDARAKYRETTGLPFIQQIEIIAPNHTQNSEIVKKFEEMKLELIYEQQPFSDALDVLHQLKKRNYLLGISSGTIESIITTYLRKISFDIVDDIMGFRPGFEKGKDHFNHILKKYPIHNSQILFIGDSLHDAKRARDNQISFIGRIGMFKSIDFEKIIPECPTIHKLSELLDYI
ncbi:MAG: HAD family hydrolase [Candidatus Hodarchaeales archaeon]|jgi:phosphoglycolate phosphatase-like HAD superfamily hydrolase